MKQGRTIFASLMLLLGTGLLLYMARGLFTAETVYKLGTSMLTRQLGSVAVLAQKEVLPSTEISPSPSASIAPSPVPVTTVAEAWDELARQRETITTTPAPLTAQGCGSLELRNETDYSVDLGSLPALPQLDTLQAGQPVVLIMHTHGTEAYSEASGTGYRTEDEDNSVIAVGETIGRVLEAHGYRVYHDKTICDTPDFNHAYSYSREVIQSALSQYPGIFLVLDIHRDAVEDTEGNQMRMACTIDGQDASQLMLVVGTDAGGLNHPNWETNLALAAILQMRLEGRAPGLMRPLNLRCERFNQDLAPLALLVEVGASGNSLTEANLSAETFGEVLSGVLDDCGGKSS